MVRQTFDGLGTGVPDVDARTVGGLGALGSTGAGAGPGRRATSGDDEGDQRERRRGEERRLHARHELARAPRPAAYTETITATPTAPPSCWVVCSRPEAEPACSGSTPREHGRGDRHEDQPAARPLSSIGPKTAPA